MRMLASSYLIFFWISVAEAAPLMGLECVLQGFYRSTQLCLTPSLASQTHIGKILGLVSYGGSVGGINGCLSSSLCTQ